MQDTELLLSLAEIAGVFVGFGALIAVRSGGASGPYEVAYMRMVVWLGMLTVIAALTPVTLDRYGLTEHQILALSSLLVVACQSAMIALGVRTPELRAAEAALSQKQRIGEGLATAFFAMVTVIAVVTIVLGLAPGLEAALYLTVVVLILMGAAMTLLELVYAQHRPASA